MSRSPAVWPLWLLLGLVLLYENGWLWGRTDLVAGVPVNLAYHVGLCLLTTLVMAAVVLWAWPDEPDGHSDGHSDAHSDGHSDDDE